jgi:hypothetical protein
MHQPRDCSQFATIQQRHPKAQYSQMYGCMHHSTGKLFFLSMVLK